MIELSKSPIDESELLICMVNHDVVRLNISVSDTLRVAVVQCLQDFEHVVSNVKVGKALVECAEVNITCIYVLHDQGGGFSHWISNDINQVDDVHTVLQSLQDLDLSSDLCLLHYNCQTRLAYQA